MRFSFARRTRWLVVLIMPALLAGLGLIVVAGGPAAPADAASKASNASKASAASAGTACAATYTIQSQWSGGFVASVTVSNTGTPALAGWTVTFTFGGDQTVTSSWNASVTQSAQQVTANNASYNGALGAGASTSFGFQGTYSSSDAAPASLTCTPPGGTISPSVVASPASLPVTQGSTGSVGIALSAAPTSNVTVAVSRTSGNSGLSVSAGGSLTFTPANWNTAQDVTIAADSSSTGAATFTANAAGYTAATFTITETAGSSGGPAPQLHVSGNKLVDANGNQVVLHGVNRSGTEFACVQNAGIFSGPDDQASITAMKTWTHVTAVRVPLNEACWNGEPYVPSADAGATYINAVKAYVSLLNSNGIVAILDLHWTDGAYTGPSSACSDANATCQKPMPDAAQSVPFWTSVASTFKGNDAVIFDLFNEPYPDIATGSETQGWQCWLNGGSSCPGFSYSVAGMQTLVNAVRSAGANNVIMLGGLTWANDMTQWLANEPSDPDHNLAASWHSYNFNACSTQSCWTSQIAPVIAKVPVIAGEIGENDCAGSYIDPLTTWLNSQDTGYLAWTWDDWNVGCNPVLITDYTGTPTAYGAAYKAILQALP
ncbi:MAG: cellulase family glycosylhydrolase [Streptosporangiaceae bacterium]|nr:cellulase family glycosylhydrolase [Streptosporangiaceae bacterium]